MSRDTVYWQAWLDIVTTINRDRALYGVSLAPLHLDPLLAEPIAINDDMAGYHVGYTENQSMKRRSPRGFVVTEKSPTKALH